MIWCWGLVRLPLNRIQNFQLNGLDLNKHKLVRADVFQYLQQVIERKEQFDLIVMDPPSFSNSRKMAGVLDVQRDHPGLIRSCLRLLSDNGTLYFSNDLRRFKLDPVLEETAEIVNITHKTVPEDFKRQKSHQCWLIRKGSN